MKAYGIDLGTTKTAIATIQSDGSWYCIPNREGQDATPSVVYFSQTTGPVVGQHALDMALVAPAEVVLQSKRYMGQSDWAWSAQHSLYSATDIATFILQKICADAQQHIHDVIQQAVISVPAHFSEIQRRATMDAAKRAGLQPLLLINEPTAASLAFGYQDLCDGDVLVVLDLGGGTLDISVLQWETMNLHVLVSSGDGYLGGQDWDELMLHHAAAFFIAEHGLDPLDDPWSHQHLRHQVIQAKHMLSTRNSTSFLIHHRNKTSFYSLQRPVWEAMSQPLLSRVERCCRSLWEHVPPGLSSIQRVQLVGGSTYMPMIQQLARQQFPQARMVQEQPDKAVVLGAAIQAHQLVATRTPEYQRATHPTVFRETRHEPKSTIPRLPGQIVAEVPVQHKIPIMHDVNTHRLGLVVLSAQGSSLVETLIPQYSPLPWTYQGTYHTAYDNQVTLELQLVEGESTEPSQCIALGTFSISGLAPLPAGQRIDISFTYDRSGLLHVQVLGKDYHLTLFA